ncbi:MAG: GTPase, partial [Planctomycetota bacterium]
MKSAPRGMRMHIGLFGRRNAGKSSLLNALTRQQVSIVSETAGTTTDPVEKPMELLPIGPVQFIDTAGIDDVGALGAQRVAKTRQALERCDCVCLVIGDGAWTSFEEGLLCESRERNVPVIVVCNKRDLLEPPADLRARLEEGAVPLVETAAPAGTGILALREALIAITPE